MSTWRVTQVGGYIVVASGREATMGRPTFPVAPKP